MIIFQKNNKIFAAIVELEKTATDDYFKFQLENGLKMIRCIAKKCGYNVNYNNIKNLQDVFLLFLRRSTNRKGAFFVQIKVHGIIYDVLPGKCGESLFDILHNHGIEI